VIPSPKTGRELVDEYFIENRTRLLEIAAFLDRLDRADDALADRDFRARAFREALAVLTTLPDASADPSADTRVKRIQMLLSDPTTEPLPALDQKSARGAYDHWQLGVAR
jgi:thioredoxin-like negative regulator of GroEL